MLIAEVGSVHDGSFGNAAKLIELAAEVGADAVKFQTHISAAETTKLASSPSYFNSETRYEYFSRTSFTKQQWSELKKIADRCEIKFLSSPFSIEAVDLLEDIGMEIYKIPSGEITNIPMLERISSTGKPVFISSGMSNWAELDAAVSIFDGKSDYTVLQCSSIYPCPPEKVGLNIISEIRNRYGCPVGFSDHTLGFSASIAAAAMGAVVIEKHFTFSRKMYGSDAKHSMEPDEFKNLVDALRDVWIMNVNPVNKDKISDYWEMKNIFQKSIVASKPLKAGTVLSIDDLAFKKPGGGISASRYKEVIGKRINIDCETDDIFRLEWFL
jgi:N,N'-diacetyllegionaminate synthase